MHRRRTLHLFAGVGGGVLADLLLGHVPIGAVENDLYCQKILSERQKDGILPWFPIFDDIRNFDGRRFRGLVDIIAGGFPCQDISAAGQGAGLSGANSGLVFEMLRIIGEVRPRFVFAENSPVLRTRGLGTVLKVLDGLGYNAKWGVLGAWHVGAPHKRNRMWIVAEMANVHSSRKLQQERALETQWRRTGDCCEELADSAGERSQSPLLERVKTGERDVADCGWWSPESDVGRVVDGCPNRVDQLRSLGNMQVPTVAALAWKILSNS